MKKLSKRLLAMLLVAVMVVAAIPFGAFADVIPTMIDVYLGGTKLYHEPKSYDVSTVLTEDSTAAYYATLTDFANRDFYQVDGAGAYSDGTLTITVSLKTHTHQYVDGAYDSDQKHKMECSVVGCDVSYLTPCEPFYQYAGDPAYNDGGHAMKCSKCGHMEIDTSEDDCTMVAHTLATEAAKEATCTSKAKTARTYCTVCGYTTGGVESGELRPHTYRNGVCTVCGASDTDQTYTVELYKTTAPSLISDQATIAMSDSAAAALTNTYADASYVLAHVTTSDPNYALYAGGAPRSTFVSLTANTTTRKIQITYSANLSAPVTDTVSVDVFVNDETVKRETRTLTVGTYYFDTTLRNYGGKVEKIRVRNGNNLRTINYGDTDSNAKVQYGDTEITLLWDASEMTIYFLRDSSNFQDVVTTKKVYFGYRLGTLPQLDGRDITWYVKGQAIDEDTIYDWTGGTYVYATPRATGDVQLIIYANGVTKNPYIANPIDVTSKVQPGGLLKASALTATIESAVGKKNLSITGLFDEAGWDYYVDNNKSTKYAQSTLDVNSALNRTGTQFIYVMVNNASKSTADSSNPKTGDNAMIGTAAIVMALAVIGMGTAFYMKKKELF